ncbi:hypothetical protein EMG79_27620 [Klebsiella pneumoniae]|uniref:DUF4871 domain-containing protein n=1 Tax=Paenibacillus antri TaxID=2582848 RepID=A0A5R9G7R6_9BACL|nr:hypothetical protein [Paenibacillus antri]TLS50120.1 hypothetical protein FE782_22580 [Paenibacillus antri]TMY74020.1 hypothetical protein EMG79_27620 [Klebsiella pneumoniae]
MELRIFISSLAIVAIMMVLSACNESSEVSVETDASPFFTTSTGAEMQGIEGKMGLLGPEFVAGKPNKHMWHFWGSAKELSGKFRAEAVNLATGEKVNPFPLDFPAPIGGPNNGADGHVPSSIELPEAGTWRLDAYFDDKLFTSIVIEVKAE